MPFKSALLFLFLTVLCAGCFDLVEEVNLRADGSGTFLFEANLSQSKTKLQTMMALDSVDGFKIPSKKQIQDEMDKARKILESSEGISKVSSKIDFDNYIFSLGFEFSNVKILDHALTAMHAAFSSGKSIHEKNGFRQEGTTFERINEYTVPHEVKAVPKKEMDLLNNASFTCIYRFDQTILSFSNADARLSKNGKALFLKLSIPDILNGTKNVSDIIQIKTKP